MGKVKEKVEKLKAKAEVFLKNDIRAFIVNDEGDYFFCDILTVGDDFLFIHNFTGKRKGKKDRLIWFDIEKIEEYQEEKK